MQSVRMRGCEDRGCDDVMPDGVMCVWMCGCVMCDVWCVDATGRRGGGWRSGWRSCYAIAVGTGVGVGVGTAVLRSAIYIIGYLGS